MGGAFRLAIDWVTKKNQNLTLERENLESKLGMLRAQVSPHFLFNTLHNIDGLIMDNQKAASDSLIKLSEVLRYQLYDSRPAENVTLLQEIDHINKYLDLQKMRIKNPEYYSMDVVGSPDQVKVAPLLFIPFVENAFKHCSESKDSKVIDIRFDISPSKVSFTCENSFDAAETEKDSASGIGLENVKQRLNLIYPGQHKLAISKENSTFKVELEIEPHDN
jgi:LytS/YehU family sensor histidine kinase